LNTGKRAGHVPQATQKTVAYLRVSTLDQDIEKNKADILHFANDHDLGKVHFVEVDFPEPTGPSTRWMVDMTEQLRVVRRLM